MTHQPEDSPPSAAEETLETESTAAIRPAWTAFIDPTRQQYLVYILPLLALCILATFIWLGNLTLRRMRDDVTAGQSAVPTTTITEALATETATAIAAPGIEPTIPTTTVAETLATTTPAGEVAVATPLIDDPICRTSPLTASAIFSPTISTISFATSHSEAGWPLNPALQFTTAVTQVQASFGFAGLQNGLAWERIWYFNDRELGRYTGSWDAGPRGQLTVYAAAPAAGFTPGYYRLEVQVEGDSLGSGSFTLIPPDTPATQPVRIAYTTQADDTSNLNLLNMETQVVTPLLKAARGPAWSSNAKGLLFYAEQGFADGPAGLWALTVDTGETIQLNGEAALTTIAWSPDGQYLASAVTDDGVRRLLLWNLAGAFAPVLGPSGDQPAWSPEGRRLAYRACDETGYHLNTIEVIGSHFLTDTIRSLTRNTDSLPAWSDNGSRIAFVRQQGVQQDIYTITYDGRNLTAITNRPTPDTAPAWLPDGRLVFRAFQDDHWGLYVVQADGGREELLTTTPGYPDWQPDRPAVSTAVLPVEPPPLQPVVDMPPGTGVLVVSNRKTNAQMTFTINNREYSIPPYQVETIPLPPGIYTWTASWPGQTSRNGRANIAAGQIAYPIIEQ